MLFNKNAIVSSVMEELFRNLGVTAKVNGVDTEVVIKNVTAPSMIFQSDDKKIISRTPLKAGDVVSYQGKNYLVNTDITKRHDYYYEGRMRHAPYTVNINASLFFPGPDYNPKKAITSAGFRNYYDSDNYDLHRNFLVNYSFKDVVTKVVGPFIRVAYIDRLSSQKHPETAQEDQVHSGSEWYQSRRTLVLVMKEFAYDPQALYAVFPLQRDMWKVAKIDFVVPGLMQVTCTCITNFGTDYNPLQPLSPTNNPFHREPLYDEDVLDKEYVPPVEPDTSLFGLSSTQSKPALTITGLSYEKGVKRNNNCISGKLKFYRGNEYNVSFYNVYFLDRNNQKIGNPIAQPLAAPHTAFYANDLVTVNFSGVNITSSVYYYLNLYPIVVPAGATQIGVFAVNEVGESETCLKIPIRAD